MVPLRNSLNTILHFCVFSSLWYMTLQFLMVLGGKNTITDPIFPTLSVETAFLFTSTAEFLLSL